MVQILFPLPATIFTMTHFVINPASNTITDKPVYQAPASASFFNIVLDLKVFLKTGANFENNLLRLFDLVDSSIPLQHCKVVILYFEIHHISNSSTDLVSSAVPAIRRILLKSCNFDPPYQPLLTPLYNFTDSFWNMSMLIQLAYAFVYRTMHGK